MQTDNAVRTIFIGIQRLKHSVSSWPARIEPQLSSTTATVTVFTPPAVPTGEPPIYIKKQLNSLETSLSWSCGTVKNPAVLVVTDWKNDAISFWKKPIDPNVFGLLYSTMKKNKVPPNNKLIVIKSTNFVWRDSFLRPCLIPVSFLAAFFIKATNSLHTIKPIPPAIIKKAVTVFISTSSAYIAKLESPSKSTPALQKADIEWNTAYHMPRSSPNCGIKRHAYPNAPMPSTTSDPFTTYCSIPTRPRILSRLK